MLTLCYENYGLVLFLLFFFFLNLRLEFELILNYICNHKKLAFDFLVYFQSTEINPTSFKSELTYLTRKLAKIGTEKKKKKNLNFYIE